MRQGGGSTIRKGQQPAAGYSVLPPTFAHESHLFVIRAFYRQSGGTDVWGDDSTATTTQTTQTHQASD